MILPTDKAYTQTKRIVFGTEKMKQEFVPLAEWIDKTYGVKPINIIYESNKDGEQPILQICFEFEKQQQQFLANDVTYSENSQQKAINKIFKKTIIKQGLSKSTTSFPFFRRKQNGMYNTDNVHVFYGAYDRVAKQETISKIPNDRKSEFKLSFHNDDIWEILLSPTIPTYFLYTNEQVKQYNKPEIIELWTDKVLEFIKEFDQFNYLKRETLQVVLDSKENFDKNYQGKLYNYIK